MRILVCGSRTFRDGNLVSSMLTGLYAEVTCGYLTTDLAPFVVIEGGAKGADAAASWWARCAPFHPHPLLSWDEYEQKGPPDDTVHAPVIHRQFPADWDRHGRAAGSIRNQRMLDEGKPDLVLAFVDKPLEESRGTADMVRRAREAGVRVCVVTADG